MVPRSEHERDVRPETTINEAEGSSRFRFKRKSPDTASHHRSQKTRRHHHRRSKRRKVSPLPVDSPSAYGGSASSLPPDAAFRESLFDALADDEGAAFWEDVYGQPVHGYPNTYRDGDTGELERMDDEEYAQYVRRKMWERSWEGIEAAREEKRQEREREKQERRKQEEAKPSQRQRQGPDYLFDLEVDESLRRGERRREKKHWKTLWEEYLQRWDDLLALSETRATDDDEQVHLRNKIAWPVQSGRRKDVNSDEIERFVKHCAESLDDDQDALTSLLKAERVRWHPDKIQQRYGFMGIDESTMQGATAVFQVFDRMWSEARHSKI